MMMVPLQKDAPVACKSAGADRNLLPSHFAISEGERDNRSTRSRQSFSIIIAWHAQGVGACSSSDVRTGKCRALVDVPSLVRSDKIASGQLLHALHGQSRGGKGVLASNPP